MEVEANTSGQTQAKTKFCKHCGGTIPQDAVMCTHCGREGGGLAEPARGLGMREGLPHAVGYVEERAQGGDGRGQRHHRLAEFGHLVIQPAQDTVQAVER